jgi:copper chaperone CopZ
MEWGLVQVPHGGGGFEPGPKRRSRRLLRLVEVVYCRFSVADLLVVRPVEAGYSIRNSGLSCVGNEQEVVVMSSRKTHRAWMASATAGRVRLKSLHTRHNPALLERIKSALEAKPEVSRVHVNPTAGSFTVHYDSSRCDKAGILKSLQDLDVIVEGVTHAPSVASPETTLTVNEAIDDLNRRLSSWFGLSVDLRTVLPLTFVGAGLWSIVRNGLMLEKVPGWLLLWLGFDLFVKTRPHDVAQRKPSAHSA